MCARFSPQQVSHAVERGCGCVRARESAVKSSIAQSTAACAGPAFGGGPARRQPVPPQGAEALAFTGRRTMNTRGTRPGLSPTFYRWAEPSLTVQPLGTGRPLAISAVYRGPDFPRAYSSSPDTDGVLQPRKSMTMLDLLAMEPAKAAPIPERNLRNNAAADSEPRRRKHERAVATICPPRGGGVYRLRRREGRPGAEPLRHVSAARARADRTVSANRARGRSPPATRVPRGVYLVRSARGGAGIGILQAAPRGAALHLAEVLQESWENVTAQSQGIASCLTHTRRFNFNDRDRLVLRETRGSEQPRRTYDIAGKTVRSIDDVSPDPLMRTSLPRGGR